MAWQAQLEAVISKDPTGLRLRVEVGYYDPAVDPLVALHTRLFQFEPTTTLAQMRQTIIDEGIAARASQARATNLNASLPVGSTVAIP